MESTEPHFIEKRIGDNPISDFEILLKQAITLIQKLTGHVWTDFNIHDPGVTILEQLCYALTDLYYKTEFNIEDILTDKDGLIHRKQHAFFEKKQILTCNPVTVNDFVKIILDEVLELDNVMLTPVLSIHSDYYIKGLYKMHLRVDSTIAINFEAIPNLKDDIKERIRLFYLSKRNICEDVADNIVVLEPQKIRVVAKVSIRYSSSPEETLLAIYDKIDSLLNPKIKFYSESELLDKGFSIEEIYCGPLLKNGFILDTDLKPIDSEIDLINFTNVISNLPNVLNIQKINITSDFDDNTELDAVKSIFDDENNTVFKLKADHFPYLDVKTFLKHITLYIDDYKVTINEKLFLDLYQRKLQLRIKNQHVNVQKAGVDYIKTGLYKNINTYYSIQNYFPVAYGIGNEGLPKSESKERKALARQLKVYLLFFEQILANYSAQLGNISNLYSTDLSESNQRSYFTKALYDIPNIQDLLKNYKSFDGDVYENQQKWKEFQEDVNNEYVTALKNATESIEVYLERKNKILDHLLGRFNRQMSHYPIEYYFNKYLRGNNIERDMFVLQWKAHVLNNLMTIDQRKIKGFNYLSEKNELSGFEYKLSLYLNINQTNYSSLKQFKIDENNILIRRKLSSVFDDGVNKFIYSRAQDSSHVQNEEEYIPQFSDEEINILMSSDENIDLSDLRKTDDSDSSQNETYVFHNQTISFLDFGIQIKNYRVVPSILKEGAFLLVYKSKEQNDIQPSRGEKWQVISSHTSREKAVDALHYILEYLTSLSVNSEGFHLVEHLLLRPKLNEPCFGFRFYDESNTVIFQNNEWLTFNERETFLTQLKEIAINNGTVNTNSHLDFQLKNDISQLFITVNSSIFEKSEDSIFSSHIKKAIDGLNKLKENQKLKYPCIKFTVKLSDNEVVEEDFYNLRATVVFPSWPARFQDDEFKLFTENIFKTLAPAYLCINFKWLGISRMQKFETLYFDWLESNKEKQDEVHTNRLALTKLLNQASLAKQK